MQRGTGLYVYANAQSTPVSEWENERKKRKKVLYNKFKGVKMSLHFNIFMGIKMKTAQQTLIVVDNNDLCILPYNE